MESSSGEKSTPKSSTSSRTRARRDSSGTRRRAVRKKIEEPVSRVTKRKVAAPKPEVRVPDSSESRKAPTKFSGQKVAKKIKRKRMIVIASVLIIGVGASAAVGLTDSGQIDVQQTIEDRNERIRNNTQDETDTLNSTVEVPVQNTSSKPNGGLRGLGVGSAPAPKPEPESEVSTSTASSSDEVASSTEEVGGEQGPEADTSDEEGEVSDEASEIDSDETEVE